METKYAIISVFDKTGIAEFASELSKLGFIILSTGGTAKTLRDAKILVTDISKYTGSPEILDGRLKTLHPMIHGGILGIRENSKHTAEMRDNKIQPIDIVVVNLYPFEKVVTNPDCKFEDAIENIDIGGPTMLRAAAKNHNNVTVICDPSDYKPVIEELKKNNGKTTGKTKFRLAKKVFTHTTRYDSIIMAHLSLYDDDKRIFKTSSMVGHLYEKMQDLRYGENPHQIAGFYKDILHPTDEPCVTNSVQLHGKELSYNNIMDADAAIDIIREFVYAPFACVILKHTNPCGAAISDNSLLEAFTNAKECDPTSAFGGIISVSEKMDAKTAAAIAENFFEVIIAPDYDKDALDILKAKKNMRLIKVAGLKNSAAYDCTAFRQVVGGILIQERDILKERIRDAKVVTKRAPTDEEWKALEFAWKVCKHVKSNAIVYTDSIRTISIGAGQMSRVDSSKIAIMKARKSLKGSVVASDAFFPFRDGVDEAAKAGATAAIQPGGSIRDEEVIAAADEHKMAMVFTGVRHFKH